MPDLQAKAVRNDYRVILDLVEPGAKVLDLGCGDGSLLELLRTRKRAVGYGVDIAGDNIVRCVERGLPVFQGDLDEGLRDFEDQSFDYVILSQTLPVVHQPLYVVQEMLRVGRLAIVSFPNFAYWRIRLQLLLRGRMPVDAAIPYEWYETPNIHHLTVNDFEAFCAKFGFRIHAAHYFRFLDRGAAWCRGPIPNWCAAYALFVVARQPAPAA